MILITKTFKKQIQKLGSIEISDIQKEVYKHSIGIENFIFLWTAKQSDVLKGYLNAKKVRIVLLFQKKWERYFPFYIVRKETKEGNNITKDSIPLLLSNITI